MQKDDSVRFFIEFVANTENDFSTISLEGLKSFKSFMILINQHEGRLAKNVKS